MRRVFLPQLLLVAAVVLGGCGSGPRGPTSGPRSTPPATPTPAPASTTRPGPSALDQLSAFVQAAQRMDAQLAHAAALVNGMAPPWTPPWPASVVSAVEAADLGPVAATIPAGQPAELLRRTILVYSDLASRRYAMRWFGREGFPYTEPPAQAQIELTDALANGAPAAARFASDLEGLIGAARVAPPVTVAGPASRAAAEVLLLVQWTDGMNGGCASTGGAVVTQLPQISWVAHGDASGTVAGVDFKAALVDGSWQVTILAC